MACKWARNRNARDLALMNRNDDVFSVFDDGVAIMIQTVAAALVVRAR
jgi:hypothetical protein